MQTVAEQVANSNVASEQNDKQNTRSSASADKPRRPRDYVCFTTLLVLIASLIPRLFLTLSAEPQNLIAPDSVTYFTPAVNLREHGAFLNRKLEPEVSRTPGYPVFLLAIMAGTGKSLSNHEDLRTVLVVQTIILSWSVVFLYWLARRILPPIMALIGALLAAFSPWGAVTAGFPLTEGLFLLILSILFFVMYLVVEHTTKLSAELVGGGFIGLLTCAAVFVRPIWPLVPIIAVALFLLCGDNRKKAWILVAVMLLCAASPVYLWKARNMSEAQFEGLSTIPGSNAYRYFVPSVKAQIKGEKRDRYAIKQATIEEESQWSKGLSIPEITDERWRRANVFVREHPFLTIYTFVLNAGEAIFHPHPAILRPARLNFSGDSWVLAGGWMVLLILGGIGLCCAPNRERDGGMIQRKWLVALLVICLLLTLASGITFGAGSRLRAPLELIVPLLTAIGLVRLIRMWRPLTSAE